MYDTRNEHRAVIVHGLFMAKRISTQIAKVVLNKEYNILNVVHCCVDNKGQSVNVYESRWMRQKTNASVWVNNGLWKRYWLSTKLTSME